MTLIIIFSITTLRHLQLFKDNNVNVIDSLNTIALNKHFTREKIKF